MSETTPQDRIKDLVSWETTNGFSTLALVREWANCRTARIDDDGAVYIADPQVGHWLDGDKLIEFARWVESH